jgi:NAD(P)-dependent dehydrogenase (short-subunit alcohol dehydrogenase family)
MAPLERRGQPDDIANVISFLVGPNGGWVNSQVVCVNGGFDNPFETQAGTTGRAPINTKEKPP